MRCSAQRRQDIIANRTRKSARAQREICWQRRPKQNCGSCRVKRLKKKKICLDHLLRAELTHSAGIFRIKITKVASGQARSHPRCSRGTRASPLPLKLGLFFFFFCFVVPSWAFYVTQTDQDGERLRGVCEQRRSSSARRVRGVHTSQALCNIQGHVAILLCALREEEKNSFGERIKMIQQSWEITSNVF